MEEYMVYLHKLLEIAEDKEEDGRKLINSIKSIISGKNSLKSIIPGKELSLEDAIEICEAISREAVCVNKRVAKFLFVSQEEFEKRAGEGAKLPENLPKRATSGSAGYDFFSPINFVLKPGESIKIPTGIKCCMSSRWVLKLYPRSGLGFKYHVQLANTVGIIDSDYFNSKENEGHIMVKLVNYGDSVIDIKRGDALCQGIFSECGFCIDDFGNDIVRDGGFGSTGN